MSNRLGLPASDCERLRTSISASVPPRTEAPFTASRLSLQPCRENLGRPNRRPLFCRPRKAAYCPNVGREKRPAVDAIPAGRSGASGYSCPPNKIRVPRLSTSAMTRPPQPAYFALYTLPKNDSIVAESLGRGNVGQGMRSCFAGFHGYRATSLGDPPSPAAGSSNADRGARL